MLGQFGAQLKQEGSALLQGRGVGEPTYDWYHPRRGLLICHAPVVRLSLFFPVDINIYSFPVYFRKPLPLWLCNYSYNSESIH